MPGDPSSRPIYRPASCGIISVRFNLADWRCSLYKIVDLFVRQLSSRSTFFVGVIFREGRIATRGSAEMLTKMFYIGEYIPYYRKC